VPAFSTFQCARSALRLLHRVHEQHPLQVCDLQHLDLLPSFQPSNDHALRFTSVDKSIYDLEEVNLTSFVWSHSTGDNDSHTTFGTVLDQNTITKNGYRSAKYAAILSSFPEPNNPDPISSNPVCMEP
jgi:hypothetical protein